MWLYVLFFFVLSNVAAIDKSAKPCPDALSLQLTDFEAQPDKSIISKGVKYPSGTYWKDGDGKTFGCPCNVTRCLRKCPKEYLLNATEDEYDDYDKNVLHVPIWTNSSAMVHVRAHEHFTLVEGALCEKESASELVPEEYEEDKYQILSNGSIYYPHMNTVKNADHYCLLQGPDKLQVIICLAGDSSEKEAPPKTFQHYLYPVLLLTSVFFLVLTLVAYALSPEMRNLHGRSLAAHCGCLLIGFFGLALVQITGSTIQINLCYSIAFMTYYFLLASFFWLNVLCFDIWWTFSGFRKMTGSLNQSSQKKFIMYCIYATVMPTIFFIITVTIQCVDSTIPHDMRPGIGIFRCWFQNDLTSFLYFNGPISVLLAFNLFFFITTTVKILKLKREVAMLKKGDSRMHSNNEDKQRFKLYMKLFLVMGLNWIAEIISWLVGGPEEYWYLTDIFNTLQGVFIFVICVWTTKTRDVLCSRFLPAKFSKRFTVRQSGPSAATKSSEASSTAADSAHGAYALKSMSSSKFKE